MKIGVLAFTNEETPDPATVARKCEAVGFESLFFPEHPIIPVEHRTPYPLGDGKIPEPYAHMPDPFITLALAASATKRLRLGTGICLVPERDPIVLAKEVATIDYYSGGRFIFGIGAGWLADETEIMGVEFKKRWEVTQEYVMAMKALWTEKEPSFSGQYVRFPKVKSYPKPLQKPHPPIHLGRGRLRPQPPRTQDDGRLWRRLGSTGAQSGATSHRTRPPAHTCARRPGAISQRWRSPSTPTPERVRRPIRSAMRRRGGWCASTGGGRPSDDFPCASAGQRVSDRPRADSAQVHRAGLSLERLRPRRKFPRTTTSSPSTIARRRTCCRRFPARRSCPPRDW